MGLYGETVFPWLMDLALAGMADLRRDLLQGASGRTLEIGAGTGLNLPHYPAAVHDLTLLTPDFPVPAALRRRMGALAMRHRFVVGSAERLPYEDGAFDTVVATLVFCTIPDAPAAAAEVRRVLKPGGRLLTLEHVRAPRPLAARWQARLGPLWACLACGCHLDRDTLAVLRQAGLQTDGVTPLDLPGLPVVRDFIVGTARRG
jgi:SAM-dependent methyltransferase